MKQSSVSYLPLLLLLASTSVADDKSVSSTPSHRVQLKDCQITLIDHVTLASDRTGIIKAVKFKEGELVKEGDLVVLIADEVALANLRAAEKKASNENELKYARVAKESADSALDRLIKANQLAVEKGGRETVPPLEIAKAQLDADKAGFSINSAEHEIGLNKLNAAVTAAELRTYSVLAEFDGVVTRIYKKKGEAVRQGDPVAEIINTDRVRIEGNVPLVNLRYAKQGAKVYVRLPAAELELLDDEDKEPFEGRITFVDVVSEPIDRKTRIYAEVENRKNILRAGLEAIMEIEVETPSATAKSPPEKNLENAKKEVEPISGQK